MKQCRLRSYDSAPPGGYPYRKFASQPLITAQARTVLAYRIGNQLPRATYAECLADVDHYQCWRLGCDPKWCVPVDANSPDLVSIDSNAPGMKPCKGCGVVVS